MTLTEFKAWFEGYTECMDSTPSKKQWKRIQARVKEIDGRSTTERIYIDRYVNSYPRWVTTLYTEIYFGGGGGTITQTTDNTLTVSNTTFEATAAMASLGTMDAKLDEVAA